MLVLGTSYLGPRPAALADVIIDMTKVWDQTRLQQLIDDEVEENLHLEYKAADALAKSDGKKREITKDVSAFTNSDGGYIIYGIKEYDILDRKHLPERPDPIDRTQFSKEWLEQVIGNIRPRVVGLTIHPVNIDSGANNVAYVVEIPQGDTAHQASDYRYYRRYNFESVPMADYEIRMVMGRSTRPELRMRATVTGGPEIVGMGGKKGASIMISLENIGKAVAKAPFIAIKTPPNSQWSYHGVDGNTSHGLPDIPHSRKAHERRMGGRTDYLIYPGVIHDVAKLIVTDLKDGDDVIINYRVAAEDMPLLENSVTVSGEELRPYLIRTKGGAP